MRFLLDNAKIEFLILISNKKGLIFIEQCKNRIFHFNFKQKKGYFLLILQI